MSVSEHVVSPTPTHVVSPTASQKILNIDSHLQTLSTGVTRARVLNLLFYLTSAPQATPPLGGYAPAGSYGPSGLRPRFALPPGIPKQPKPGLRPRALRSPFQSSPASGGFITSPWPAGSYAPPAACCGPYGPSRPGATPSGELHSPRFAAPPCYLFNRKGGFLVTYIFVLMGV